MDESFIEMGSFLDSHLSKAKKELSFGTFSRLLKNLHHSGFKVSQTLAERLEHIFFKEYEDLGILSNKDILIIWEAFEYFDNFHDKKRFDGLINDAILKCTDT